MTDNEHNLSTTKIHTPMDKIDGIDQSISESDDIVATDTNVETAKSSVKRRHYQRKRREGTVEQISSFTVEKNPKIPTPPSSLQTAAVKSEYDEKEKYVNNIMALNIFERGA
uniref:Uncharacterized protein n=1 Tax=Elaeophora elaphi TaxID=1147741 RepID=A0A0R3S732_9BILA